MKESNSRISGILSIVSGSLGLLGFLFIVLIVAFLIFMPDMAGMGRAIDADTKSGLLIAQIVYAVIGLFTLILGVLAILGGVYALKRKYWGLGLAAAIAGVLVFFPTGIPAIVFHIMARQEFQPREPVHVELTQ